MNNMDRMNDTTRRAVLKAVLESFQQTGYKKTYLREIAKSTGISISALHRYFPAKRDIFKELFHRERKNIRVKLEAQLLHADYGNREDVEKTFHELLSIVVKSTFLKMIYIFGDFPVWYCFRDSQPPESDPLAGQSSLLESFINKAQKAGTVRDGDASVIAHAVRIIFSLILGESDKSKKPHETNLFLFNTFVRGLMKDTR